MHSFELITVTRIRHMAGSNCVPAAYKDDGMYFISMPVILDLMEENDVMFTTDNDGAVTMWLDVPGGRFRRN